MGRSHRDAFLTHLPSPLKGSAFLPPHQCGPLRPVPKRKLSVRWREDKACSSPSITGLLGPQPCELPATPVPRELRCGSGSSCQPEVSENAQRPRPVAHKAPPTEPTVTLRTDL